MSEGIMHTAAVDDCARLIECGQNIVPEFKAALAGRLELARLGGITRFGDRHNPGLIDRMRVQARERGLDELAANKLAFVIGWMSHRAADRIMKRAFREADPHCMDRPRDCSVYHDVFLFRELYEGGRHESFNRHILAHGMATHSAAGAVNVEALEDLLRAAWQRMLIAMHTFIPDDSDIDRWIERVIEMRQTLRVDLRRYAEALARPDPDKVKRFITDIRFYERDDPLIVLLARLRSGQAMSEQELKAALESAAANGCLYARIVAKAFAYVSAASDFFKYRINQQTLDARLDIGLPEY